MLPLVFLGLGTLLVEILVPLGGRHGVGDGEDSLRTPLRAYFFGLAVLSFIAVTLIVVSFLIPPQGVVDSSVLAAVGEIFAFAALFAVWEAVDKGIDAKIVHGNTTVTLDGNNDGQMPE